MTGAVIAAFAASAAVAITARAGVTPAAPEWTKVWSDDFTGAAGSGVDAANWRYDTGTGYPGGASQWGTNEVETMTTSTRNVYQDGSGHLAIKPTRDASGSWSSGRIETQRSDFAAPAGGKLRVEASIQQPDVSGAAAAGYWPAFWLLGAGARPAAATWPDIGEIDMMEDVNGLGSVFGTLHCGTASGGPCKETTGRGSGQHACTGCQTGYHTYAMEYDRSVSPEQIRWYLDGTNYFTLTADQVDATAWADATHHGFFIILDLAMGGAFPAAFGAATPTAATSSGVPMNVDYVAVYTCGGASPSASPPGTSPSGTSPSGTSPSATSPSGTSPSGTSPSGTSPSAAASATSGAGTTSASATIRAEAYSAQSGTRLEPTSDVDGRQDVGWIGGGDWLRFDNVDFGTTPVTQVRARVASGAPAGVSGLVQVRLDAATNPPVGSLALGTTGGWQSWRTVPANLTEVTGTHTVYLTFASGQPADFVNVNWLTFSH